MGNIAPKVRARVARVACTSADGIVGEVAAADAAVQRRLTRLKLDLHDGPMQDLAAVGFVLANLRRELGIASRRRVVRCRADERHR